MRTPGTTLADARDLLDGAEAVTFLTGAGVSAESGVPTFRGGGDAPLWRDVRNAEDLSHPDFLHADPRGFWEWMQYRRELVARCAPNAAHLAIAAFQATPGTRVEVVTQNVDGLHHRAGSRSVLELHGSLWRARGIACEHTHALLEVALPALPPPCPTCGGPLRPDIVLFDEFLDERVFQAAFEAVVDAHVLVVVGTSALVMPAATLPLRARRAGVKVIVVNPEPTPIDDIAHVVLRERASVALPFLLSAAAT